MKYKVPVVISSLGAVPEVNAAVHSYGGIVLHDVINDRHARSAIRKGADGLIAVATGAGGHAGTLSPFALVQEIREWFDGPLLLAGAIANGGSILAAQAMGADHVDLLVLALAEVGVDHHRAVVAAVDPLARVPVPQHRLDDAVELPGGGGAARVEEVPGDVDLEGGVGASGQRLLVAGEVHQPVVILDHRPGRRPQHGDLGPAHPMNLANPGGDPSPARSDSPMRET